MITNNWIMLIGSKSVCNIRPKLRMAVKCCTKLQIRSSKYSIQSARWVLRDETIDLYIIDKKCQLCHLENLLNHVFKYLWIICKFIIPCRRTRQDDRFKYFDILIWNFEQEFKYVQSFSMMLCTDLKPVIVIPLVITVIYRYLLLINHFPSFPVIFYDS